MSNEEKIKKLEFLFDYAIINISPTEIYLDKDDVWKHIDNIIKIAEYIETLKHKGEKIADD